MAPKYPNQQLRSVSLETFFPGRFATSMAWPAIQEMVQDQLPNLFVPSGRPGDAPALRPYQLRNQAGTKSLALALNQATYITWDYPGFDAFVDEAVPLLTSVHQAIGVTQCTRIAYRYENAIGVSRDDDGALRIGEIVRLGPASEWLGKQGHRDLNLSWRRVWERGEIHGHVFSEPEDGRDVLRITIAADVRDAILVADAVNATHERAHDTFEQMITESFRSFLEWVPTKE